MESIDDPLTDSQNPATNTTTTTITTAPPIPRSRKGRKQHKQLQSTKGLVEAVRSRNTARDGKTRE